MIVSAVLRRSVAFDKKHVYWLARQVAQHMPGVLFMPFSDVELDIPHERLAEGYPSWWAKMEAYRRLPTDTVLMLDLDTVIVKPWTEIPVPKNMAYMSSFPGRPDKILGAWQLSSPELREAVSSHFASDPEEFIRVSEGCDQKYYQKYWANQILPISTVAPDLCVSYKLQAKPHGIWPNTAFVLFHGLPRPWQVSGLEWNPPSCCKAPSGI